MSCQHDNIRPLLCRPAGHLRRRYRHPAKVIPLRPHLQKHRLWSTVGYCLLTIAAFVMIAASITLAWRSARDMAGTFILPWPL